MNASAGPGRPGQGHRVLGTLKPIWQLLHASVLTLALVTAVHAADPTDRLLVRARAGVAEKDLNGGLAPYRAVRQRLGQHGWHVVTVPAGMRPADMQRRLRTHPMFEHVEMDRLHPMSQVLNDTFASSLWHLERLALGPAWADAKGLGKGVTVAVIDSGVQADHPDLQGVLVSGWNVVDASSNTTDRHGHGTSVVGLLAAQMNNGQGVVGLASGARVMPIRVTQPDGNARTSDIAMGLQRAADQGARIANISFDGVMGSTMIRSVAQNFYRQGGLVVVAAGNRGLEDSYSPQPGMLVVGAVDERDARPAWASYGGHLTVAAPADGLWTTGLGGGYRVVWGTSFATPLVAGVVALMWEVAPEASPALIEQWLRESAVDLGVPGPDAQYGSGRLNASGAVAAAKRWRLAQAAAATSVLAGGAPPAGGAVAAVAATSPTVVVGVPTPSMQGAWLALDVDTAPVPAVSRVQLWVGSRLLLTDPDAPFSLALNLTDLPLGILRLRLIGLDAAGAEVGRLEMDVMNNRQSLILPPVRLTPVTLGAVSPGSSTGPATGTNAATTTDGAATRMTEPGIGSRPGTGWSALRRNQDGRGRQ